ncbi:MAG: MMPL family transporter [Desulfobulbaceae bacterium]
MARLLIWLVLFLGCCLLIFTRARVQSDISLFLPAAATPKEELLVNELREGPASRLILLAIEGGDEAKRAESSRRLAETLRTSDFFVRVVNGQESVSPEEQALLFRYRYLIGPEPAANDFQPDTLRQALNERLRDLRSPVSPLHRQLVARDPTGVMLAMVGEAQGQAQPAKRYGVWFNESGRRALLLAETRAGGFALDRQEEAVRTIEAAFAPLAADLGTELTLSGPGVYGVLSRDLIRGESSRLSVTATLLVCLLLLAAYRSLPFVLLGALPVLSAVVAGVAAVTVGYGAIHGITLAFGITLIGVTIDYPLHLFSHLRADEPPPATLARIWPTMFLGALTTCFGFLAMFHTDFSGLAQLAVFAVTGLLAALFTTRWLMPTLVAATGSVDREPARKVRWFGHPPSLSRGSRMAVVGLALLALLSLIFLNRSPWEDDLAALSPVAPELIALDRELRTELGAPEISRMIALRGESAEEVLRACEKLTPALERLRAREALAGYLPPSRFLPSPQAQSARQAALPAQPVLAAALAEALADLPFKPGFFAPFVEEVEQSRTMPLLSLRDLEGTTLGLRLASQLIDTGRGWLAIIPLAGVRDQEAVVRAVAQAGVSGFALNLREEMSRLVSGFRDDALVSLGLGLACIVAALAVGLRSTAGVVRILAPVLLALGVDLALLLWSGQRLSLFHLVSLLLVLGITLDYSLFFNRRGDGPEFRCRTLYAISICALSTLLVFGMLALSKVPVLAAIGRTVAFGVLAGFVMSMVLAKPTEGPA